MLYLIKLHTKLALKRILKEEKGEGMVGWIVAALLTVTIVVFLHGQITGWLGDFWDNIQGDIDSIVSP